MCNQKLTGSQFSLLHEPNYKVNEETEKENKPLTVRKGSPTKWGLWWERFKEKLPFEFQVEKGRSDGQ